MAKEIEQFKSDLLASARQMKTGKSARITTVDIFPAAEARNAVGLSQARFAALMGGAVRTLQEWKQGRCYPTGAAKTLLRVIKNHPEVLLEMVETAG